MDREQITDNYFMALYNHVLRVCIESTNASCNASHVIASMNAGRVETMKHHIETMKFHNKMTKWQNDNEDEQM